MAGEVDQLDPEVSSKKIVTIVLDDADGSFGVDWRGVPWLQFVGVITEIWGGILNGNLFDQAYGADDGDDGDG